MKIALDPMPALRVKAVANVNARFAALVDPREVTWARKRDVAGRGAPYPDTFMQEAALRGVTPAALADIILSKADPGALADARELRRQRIMAEIDAATTPFALGAIVDKLSRQ